jgi:excisionase family DNA binding protein
MATTDTLKRYLSVKETGEYLGLSRHTIYRMIKSLEIPFTTFGRVKRFDREKLDRWIAARSVEGKT